MRPSNRPIAIERGDTYQHLVTFVDAAGDPVDVSANSYAAQVRRSVDDPDVLAAMDIDTAGAADGAVWLTIDASVTGLLEGRRDAWDLQETGPTGLVTTLLAGHADVLGDVTRDLG
jgi:hypothetical protein